MFCPRKKRNFILLSFYIHVFIYMYLKNIFKLEVKRLDLPEKEKEQKQYNNNNNFFRFPFWKKLVESNFYVLIFFFFLYIFINSE